jgi:hypothetical protein
VKKEREQLRWTKVMEPMNADSEYKACMNNIMQSTLDNSEVYEKDLPFNN